MTMTIDANQQRFGSLNLGHMSSYSNQPHFTNPWVSSSAPQTNHGMYVSSGGLGSNPLSLDRHAAHHHQHPQQQQPPPPPPSRASTSSNASMASYGSIPVSSASAGSSLSMVDPTFAGSQDLLSMPQDLMSLNRMQTSSAAYGDPAYTTAASPVHATYAASPTPYDGLGYAPAPMRQTFALAPEADPHARRYSQPGLQNDDRRSFADALEASQGMLSMKFDNQETPRAGVYNNRGRGSGDSYGFPSTHSTSSSVSSTGFSPYYGSVDSSVSDYSTGGSDIESVTHRTLPRPQGLMPSSQPPAPQSMMSQFSSKVSSSTQKKHKCKVCDKRFTRPSSLQTHMYSHTGEKPFSCEVEGCGRHFSVVSNLRRHRKVHKGEARSEAGSEDHHSD